MRLHNKSQRPILILSFNILWFLILSTCSQQTKLHSHPIRRLWPREAPGSKALELHERVIERSNDSLIHNRAVSLITKPAIELFIPEKPNGTAILICPGGAYAYQAWDKEGVDIARWLNKLGITAFILKYRLPAEGHVNGKDVPLQDAQRAMRIIRANAVKWDLDPDRVGVIGFSAGGHLASSLATGFQRKVYFPVDKKDSLSARPDFMVLMYPVISMEDSITHEGSRENLLGRSPDKKQLEQYSTYRQVTSSTPPTLIMAASDDQTVDPQNSWLFYYALSKKGVHAEIHLMPVGGHGFGLRDLKGKTAKWPEICENWLRRNEFVPR